MKKLVVLLAFVSCCLSCEKTIDLQPSTLEAVLVVDGIIESDQPPFIVLSKSLNYFSTISPAILNASQVHQANVVLSDGNKSHKLKEYTIALGGGYTFSYYSTDSSNLSSALTGQTGKTYKLTITVDGKEYLAETLIPKLEKKIDSLWWKPAPGNADSNKVSVMAKITDPPGYGNYIRYFTRINNENFLPGANSAFDDQVVDGTTYEVQVDKGINRNDPPKFEDYGFFTKGDTITIKFCNIDKHTYDFWRTLEYSYQSVGNPFSTPTTVLGNISNGGLGAFSGYAVQFKSLVIPK